MDFPVLEAFVTSADPSTLAEAARDGSPEWPAAFVQLPDSSWVYRIVDVDEWFDKDEETNELVPQSRARADVFINEVVVQQALDNHIPGVVPPTDIERLQAKNESLQDLADSLLTDMLMVYDILINNGLI